MERSRYAKVVDEERRTARGVAETSGVTIQKVGCLKMF
jgi:hypothetical protein